MTPTTQNKIRYATFSLSLFALAGIAAAQDQAPHPWRSVDDPPPAGAVDPAPSGPSYQPNLSANPDYAQAYPAPAQAPPAAYPAPPPNQGNYPPPNYPAQNYPAQNYPQQPYPAQGNYPPPQGANNYPPSQAPVNLPAQLTIKSGTYVTVRVNQWLSSDRNQQGDTFSATLDQPLVVDGFVVAQRGQTVTGRVTEAQKAGRVEGTSRLGVELTDLTLVDGQTVSIRSEMIHHNGPTSTGRDAAAIGTTTALGAIIGAGADWGRGAAIGAGAGAAAGVLGVLLTRGQPTVIYPESAITFRIEQPVNVATTRAPQAFQYAERDDYGQAPPAFASRPPAGAPYPPAYGAPAPAPYAYAYPYPYYGGFSVYVGPRYGYFYGGGYRGYYRRH